MPAAGALEADSDAALPAAACYRGKEVAQKEHVEDFKRTVMGMSEMLEIIQGEQRYLQRKIARHAQTVVGGMQLSMIHLLRSTTTSTCSDATAQPGDVSVQHRCTLMLCMESHSRRMLS